MGDSVQIVGILNVTPDSYHDGGQYVSVDDALSRAGEMVAEGVDIIEIGGEAYGPGLQTVNPEEEIQRTVSIVQSIRKQFPDTVLACDTCKASVAEALINAGVSIVNDTMAGRFDPDMFTVVAEKGVDMVLMYAKDAAPQTTKEVVDYDDVVVTIEAFLTERKQAALDAGIHADRLIFDPGMGWYVSGDPQYSFQILAQLHRLQALGPLYISPSRKSFLADSEQLLPPDRLPGTIAASAIAALHGARYIRTHDVVEVRRACEVAQAIKARL